MKVISVASADEPLDRKPMVTAKRQFGLAKSEVKSSLCRAIMAGMLIVGLSGCVSSPTPVSRYTLPLGDAQAEDLSDDAGQTVTVAPVSTARYLRHDGILMQLSDIELRHADNHLWAEPLERQLDRTLKYSLAQNLANTQVLQVRPGVAIEESNYRLTVDIDRFQGRHDGKAVVGGEWEIRNDQGRRVAHRRFQIEEPLGSDGYPALVRSLGRAWQQAIAEMGEALEARLD
ncbi:MAG: hypothetical protein CL583_07155 [Alteromonadaceae bacterium]|nr:hypothetical protein [Alteromonadaceae bacterium]|tara:strand:+ start:493 stop:1185 length:693 start_codon:yes stop_codon:yes gene_type:complete